MLHPIIYPLVLETYPNTSSGMTELKQYTWEEVKKHTTREDCWVVVEREIDGKKKGIVLDITHWAPKHPGGSIIYDGAGGDCTVMFWCYHPLSFINNSTSYINKYTIGEVKDYECVYHVGSELFITMKRRMEAKISKRDRCRDPKAWLKTFLIVMATALFFYLGWIKGYKLAVILLGVCTAQIAVSMMHDAIHSSFSKSQWVCGIVAWIWNLTGSNFLAYRRVHAFGHHAYTSHDEYDSSIPRSAPIIKLHDKLPVYWFQRFQHFYVWLVFAFGQAHFWWGDLGELTQFWNYPRRPAHVTKFQWFYVVAGKLLFAAWYFGISLYLFPVSTAVMHMLMVSVTQSLLTIIFFAVNHWTDKAVLVNEEEIRKHTKDWVTLQVITSTNFAPKSWFWTHLSGGLNLQIEHHLFPALIHTRIPEVTDIVRDTCMEYGLDYDQQCYPSFYASVKGMINWLRNVGQVQPLKPFPNVSDPTSVIRKKHA